MPLPRSPRGGTPLLLFLAVLVLPMRLAGLDPKRSISQYALEHWQSKEGLRQSTVQAIAQTREGYLWLGTRDGLVRFDGVRFVTFDRSNTPALAHENISDLAVGSDGSLWVGMSQGGLLRYRNGSFTALTQKDGLSGESIRSLLALPDGSLWIGTFGAGLNEWRDGKVRVYTREDGLASSTVRALEPAAGGGVWAGTDAGLHKVSGGKVSEPALPAELRGGFVSALHEAPGGELWVGVDKVGLVRLRQGQARKFTEKDGLCSHTVRHIHRDRDGNLWVASSGGLNRVRGERLESFTQRDGLGHAYARYLFEDVEGALWIGLFGGGLNRLKDSKFANFSAAEGLSDEFAYTILEGRDGSIWIGTESGGLNRLRPDGPPQVYRQQDGLPSNSVWSLAESRDGTLWIGTGRGGLCTLRNGRLRRFGPQDGLEGANVQHILERADGSIWAATSEGLGIYERGRWRMHKLDVAEPSQRAIRCLLETAGGRLIAGANQGLYEWAEGRLRAIALGAERAPVRVHALYEDRAGTIWIATDGKGLFRLQGGQAAPLRQPQTPALDVVYRILEDGGGDLWFSTNRGILRAGRAELEKSAGYVLYGVADGMRSSECNGGGGGQPAGWRARDGRLWFPTVKGVAVIDPANLRMNKRPPPVVVEGVEGDERPLPGGGRAVLAPGTANVAIHYSGLSLLAPQQVKFRYKLEGFDQRWTEAGTRRSAFYTHLPPGAYRFRVTACNNDGVWNESGAATEIEILPQFYQTPWFMTLCIATGLGGLYWAARLRERRVRAAEAQAALQRANADLEVRVSQRTSELAAVNEDLRREIAGRERLEQQVSQMEKMDAIGRLAGGVAHDFNNLLTVINGYASLVLNELPQGSSARPGVTAIVSAGERAAALTAQLLAFSRKQVLQLKTLELPQVVDEMEEMLRRLIEEHIELQVTHAQRDLAVQADPHQLQRVVLNLVLNARDAMPEGGRLDVATYPLELQEPLDVRGERMPPGQYAVLAISDTGKGMPDEVLARLFEPFFTTKDLGRGTGMGLSTVYGIVRQSNGYIGVESSPSRGSTFRVYLPRVEAPAAAESAGPAANRTRAGSGRILLVEDERAVRELAARALRGHGYEVVAAADGAAALAELKDGRDGIDLLVTDVVMPGMAGAELAQRVRQMHPEVAVLMMSGYPRGDCLPEDLTRLGWHYIQKPFVPSQLAAAVAAILEK